MIPKELTKAYRTFFKESEAGRQFEKTLLRLIDSAHESAENDPDHARDYTQHAKGIRQVIDHIASVSVEPKKGGKKR